MSAQGARFPAPPPPPPKDSHINSSYRSTLPPPRPQSRFINSELAEAVRDSVHIGSSQQSVDLAPPFTDFTANQSSKQPQKGSLPRRTPSPLPPGAAEPFIPSHGYSQSSPDMSAMSRPQLPSQRMAEQNPFEQDELEPAGSGRIRAPEGVRSVQGTTMDGSGVIPPSRAKFNRAFTG